ncbi:hypothetical protein MVEN_00698600 [Mycena venus]|uniref:Uncharacterized protein n=1 Tax=Mycena venus TaxID=2733690 RepID=A0A8H7D2J6_9AGAR|nr:hypothetical protein MVEN_00698600 [Mycena venus]
MKLSIAATLATLVSLAIPTLAQLTPAQIVAGINLVSNISQNSNNVLTPLSTSTDADTVMAMSQTLVNNFNSIINDVGALTSGLEATPPIDVTGTAHSRRQTAGATIVAALDNFVAVHQAFLATVIGKHSIFAQFQVTAPIAAVLRSLEAAIDSFAFALINVIPTEARRAIEPQLGSVMSDKSALDTAVGNTITTYSERPSASAGCTVAAYRCRQCSAAHAPRSTNAPLLQLPPLSSSFPQPPAPGPVLPATPPHALPLRLAPSLTLRPLPLHTVPPISPRSWAARNCPGDQSATPYLPPPSATGAAFANTTPAACALCHRPGGRTSSLPVPLAIFSVEVRRRSYIV